MTPQEAYATIQKTLLSLVMETPTLIDIETGLRQAGHETNADTLDRLVQDIGLELKRAMDAPAPGDATAGEKTMEINALYQPVTADRLYDAFAALAPLINDESLQAALQGLIEFIRTSASDYTKARGVIATDTAASPTPAPGPNTYSPS